MLIKFLGTGNASSILNYHTSILIEKNNKRFLIDGGGDLKRSLYASKIPLHSIDSMYVSHLHHDHAGHVEDVGFGTFWSKHRIRLYGNANIINYGWEHCWQAGLESIQDKRNSLNNYFDIVTLRENETFMWEGLEFKPIQTVHIMNDAYIVPSYGLLITDIANDARVFITTDTQFAPNQLMDFYRKSNLIIQDIENTPFKSGVHAHMSDLVTLPEDIKAKMILTHFNDTWVKIENNLDWEKHKPDLSQEAYDFWSTHKFKGIALPGSTANLDIKE